MPRRDSNPLVDVIGLLLIVFGILCFAATISYSWLDVGFLANPPNEPAQNILGRFGAYLGYSTFQVYGVGGFFLPLILFGSAALVLMRAAGRFGLRLGMLWIAFTAVVLLLQMGDHRFGAILDRFNMADSGGLLGHLVTSRALLPAVGKGMTILLLVSLWFAAIIMLFNVSIKDLCIDAYYMCIGGAKRAGAATSRAADSLRAAVPAGGISDEERGKGLMVFPDELLSEVEEDEEDDEFEELAPAPKSKRNDKKRARKEKPLKKLKPAVGLAVQTAPPPLEEDEVLPWEKGLPDEEPAVRVNSGRKASPATKVKSKAKTAKQEEMFSPEETESTNDEPYELPPLGLLDPLPQRKRGENRKDIEARGDKLIDTLKDFKVEAELTNAVIGPVVTTYELLPAPGVRVEKIANLASNISLSLKAESIRVQAPIPGKGVVGIEIPNAKPSIVYSRELMEVKSWGSKKRALPLIIGKDAAGRNIIADLAEMPHLLIAGATGAGKSVCMNSLLAGLLMSRSPDELRLLLVDPKIVEFTAFNDLPHLVVPVITDATKVSMGLKWAISEMEKRYKLFGKVGVRNIKSFNNRTVATQPDLFDLADEAQKESRIPDTLPYIVIVIDELADLMMVAQSDIENAIARLAQLSRAVGIHMVIATQRPSVNVITGTIKANFPARIGFQVAQKVDSRTILDANGADQLLGKGDMLFLPPGTSRLVRAQGALTTDDEINRVVAFIKNQGAPDYEISVQEKIESNLPEPSEIDEADKALLEKAVEIIRQTRRASTSSLQRRLRIGYNRAARLMDLLEDQGYVGPPNGSDPREILIDLDGEIPSNASDYESNAPAASAGAGEDTAEEFAELSALQENAVVDADDADDA